MAARIIANLLVAGGSVLLKAASQAYQKAIANAARNGVAQEAASGAAVNMFGKKSMTIEEARLILGLNANSTLEDLMKRYQKMYDNNEENGTFYLQSKVQRAKERIEAEFQGEEGG
eukprot:CAMPEP_0197610296 /NCGR_PEP_ID=MMETSP1326-20131121/53036_1 /TAXON_ID=1155430 /ORGANISM="Genus nov. species nov., Strain RCC2288" /LENGTH=115 /DNA_ID=CAMNT_0043178799 /DNA_START=92 /DNA_END=436 /DNA_ORIENTATION=+